MLPFNQKDALKIPQLMFWYQQNSLDIVLLLQHNNSKL